MISACRHGRGNIRPWCSQRKDDGLQPVVLDDPAADVALALPGVAGEKGGAVVNLGDAAAERGVVLHLAEHVGQKEHLAVAAAGDEGVFGIAGVLDDEARVFDAFLSPLMRSRSLFQLLP